MSEQYPENPVLVVDDELNILKSFRISLQYSGISNILACSDSRAVMPLLEKQPVEVVLLDLFMPDIGGEELLGQLKEKYPHIPVIIITAVNEVETAVNCIQKGAADYLVKPVERNHLVSCVRRMIELRALRRENLSLKNRLLENRLQSPAVFADIVTRNDRLRAVFKYMEAVAESAEPVLITGETGVGKELFARALHRLSRRKGEFVSVNVSGLDDNVFSDTLFGHSKGAFTDAHQVRKGLVEQAVEGTLFLDEIGDLSNPSQVKLLRLLQEKEYYPLGADRAQYARAHLLFSTNRELDLLVEEGTFRSDLFFRMHIHHIQIPPLRERKNDLPLLLEHFIKEACEAMKRPMLTVPPELLPWLTNYAFPGNVRELRALVFDAVSISTGEFLSTGPFKGIVAEPGIRGVGGGSAGKDVAVGSGIMDFSAFSKLPTIREVEAALTTEALKRSEGNVSQAAGMLGLTRQTLSKRLKNV